MGTETVPVSDAQTPGEVLARYMATHTRMDRSGTEFIYRDADSRVLLTAPHNKAVLRDDSYKRRDSNVGVLAVEAARIAGVSALVPVTPGDDDGNWSATSRFRQLLLQIAVDVCVLDVHGMSDAHGFDLVIGTAGGASPEWLVEILVREAASRSLRVDVRHTGALAAGSRTITALANAAFAGGAQLEFSPEWRTPRTNPEGFSCAVEYLAAAASAADIHLQTL